MSTAQATPATPHDRASSRLPAADPEPGGMGAIPASARLFLALWPHDAECAALHARAIQVATAHGGRASRRDTLHLTLVFLGDCLRDDLARLIDVLAAVEGRQFALRLDRLGHWPGPRIAWVAPVTPPVELLDLASRLNTALAQAGFPSEARPYAPHVTLARKLPQAFATTACTPIVWRVDDFVLVESVRTGGGVTYRVSARFPLEANPSSR